MNSVFRKCDKQWYSLVDMEDLNPEEIRVYLGDKQFLHPCGSIYDEEYPSKGKIICNCKICHKVREYMSFDATAKSCPFCGYDSGVILENVYVKTQCITMKKCVCPSCKASTGLSTSTIGAYKKWNMRNGE